MLYIKKFSLKQDIAIVVCFKQRIINMKFSNIAQNKLRTINMILLDNYENYILQDFSSDCYLNDTKEKWDIFIKDFKDFLQKYEINLDVNILTGYKDKDGN